MIRRLLAGLLIALLPIAASAQLLLTGAGAGSPVAIVYDATLGVLIGKDAAVGQLTALGVTDSKSMWVSWWEMTTPSLANFDTSVNGSGQELLVNTRAGGCEGTAALSPGICLATSDAQSNPTRAQLNFTGSVSGNAALTIDLFAPASNAKCPNSTFLQSGDWHHYIAAIDPANNAWAVYIDKSDMVNNGASGLGSGCITTTSINNITTNLNSSNGFWIANNNTATSVTWSYINALVVGQDAIVCTSASPITTANGAHACPGGANTIPPDILGAIVDCSTTCRPVDLGANGNKPTGLQPALFLHGGASSFPTNLGSATTTTLPVVAAQTGGVLFDAPYGPNGIPAHQATMRWLQGHQSATVTSNHITTDPGGNAPRAAELVVIMARSGNSSGGTPTGAACPASGGAGGGAWSSIGPINDTNELSQTIVCYALNPTDLSGQYTIPWTTAGTRSTDWIMAYYTNVASVDQTGSKLNANNATSHLTVTAATKSTTSANETVLGLWSNWASGRTTTPSTPPGSPNVVRYRTTAAGSGSGAFMMLTDQYGVALGADPSRTATSAAGDSSAGFVMTLVPN